MANETTYTTADDLRYSAIINTAVIKELRGANVCAKTCRNESLAGKPSVAMDFPIWPTMTAAAVAEGTDLTTTAITTTKATVTASEIGVNKIASMAMHIVRKLFLKIGKPRTGNPREGQLLLCNT